MAKSKKNKAAPATAANATSYRLRVRMYRQGLGDCFLLTFPRKDKAPFHMLIDCGALQRDQAFMKGIVQHIRDSVRDGAGGMARLDVVVATHEHRDHLSGFNQARDIFDADFEFGAVWMGWTENLTQAEIKTIKETRRSTAAKLSKALSHPQLTGSTELAAAAQLLQFGDGDTFGSGTIAEALEYLKARGKKAGSLKFLEPGQAPLELEGVDGVRVYVLGPPKDPILLKSSEVTKKALDDGFIYHLAGSNTTAIDAIACGLDSANPTDSDRYSPFAKEHRIMAPAHGKTDPYYDGIASFVASTYDNPSEAWRRIDTEWTRSFGQLALDLDSDTNNTSLVLAFEFVETGEVALFVGDAQLGNWQSWASVEFDVPGRPAKLKAHDLVARTKFYKVGHHCSHNATLKRGGLELMARDDLTAFIPLDKATATKVGWDMPASPLLKALQAKCAQRVVISDVNEQPPGAATRTGVLSSDMYIDYFI